MRTLRSLALALLLAGCATTGARDREPPRAPPPSQPSLASGLVHVAGLFLWAKYGDDSDVYPSLARYK